MKTNNKAITIPDFLIFLQQVNKRENQSTTDVQLATGITYSHLHYLKKTLASMNLITIKKDSIRTLLNLTDNGKQVVEQSLKLFALLNINEENIQQFRKNGRIKKKETDLKPTDITGEDNGGEDTTTQE